MKVVVEDANVLLDLANAEILSLWFNCNYEHLTTHLVWQEVKNEKQRSSIQPFIKTKKLILRDINPEAWPEIAEFSAKNSVSISDASVWILAKQEKPS